MRGAQVSLAKVHQEYLSVPYRRSPPLVPIALLMPAAARPAPMGSRIVSIILILIVPVQLTAIAPQVARFSAIAPTGVSTEESFSLISPSPDRRRGERAVSFFLC
jgi:hypothetical protein